MNKPQYIELSKEQALNGCSKCTKALKEKCVFLAEMRLQKVITNPPECLLFILSEAKCQPVTNEAFSTPNKMDEQAQKLRSPSPREEKPSFYQRTVQSKNSKLTKTEQEVLTLISRGYKDTLKVKAQRNCSLRAVQLIFKNLKEKGAINQFGEILRFGDGSGEEIKKVSEVQTPEQPPPKAAQDW